MLPAKRYAMKGGVPHNIHGSSLKAHSSPNHKVAVRVRGRITELRYAVL